MSDLIVCPECQNHIPADSPCEFCGSSTFLGRAGALMSALGAKLGVTLGEPVPEHEVQVTGEVYGGPPLEFFDEPMLEAPAPEITGQVYGGPPLDLIELEERARPNEEEE